MFTWPKISIRIDIFIKNTITKTLFEKNYIGDQTLIVKKK